MRPVPRLVHLGGSRPSGLNLGESRMNAPAKSSIDCMLVTARGLAFAAGLSLPLAFATGSYAQPAREGPPSASPPVAADHHHHRSVADMAANHAARLRTLLQ